MNDGGVCRTAPATPGLLTIAQTAQNTLSGQNYITKIPLQLS